MSFPPLLFLPQCFDYNVSSNKTKKMREKLLRTQAAAAAAKKTESRMRIVACTHHKQTMTKNKQK